MRSDDPSEADVSDSLIGFCSTILDLSNTLSPVYPLSLWVLLCSVGFSNPALAWWIALSAVRFTDAGPFELMSETSSFAYKLTSEYSIVFEDSSEADVRDPLLA